MIIFYVVTNSAMTPNDHMKKVAVDNKKEPAKFEAHDSYFVPSTVRGLQNYRYVINFQMH